MSDAHAAHDDHMHHDHRPETKGAWQWIARWLTTTNHKDIGTLYLWFALAMFIVAGLMAMAMRVELFRPGLVFLSPDTFNTLVTMHGLIMVFGAIMPAAAGLANWQLPMMLGAPDMALPRLNNFSFWILPFAALLLVSTLFMEGSGPNFGWTMYAPLSTTYAPPSTDFMIFAVHMLGVSSILAALNIIATILNLRAPTMRLMQMPMFVWVWLVTAFLLIAIMPVLAGAVTMMLADRNFGTSFFTAAGGGDPLLFQHVFWFFGHPEVYVIIMPAFGVMSEIIPTFSRKRLFGYHFMVYAVIAIALLSFVVWAHHMFVAGITLTAELVFMYLTMLIAVPTGIKVFNWVTTMYKGSLTFETPMLFAIGFVILFTFGGFSGLMLSLVPADYQYHDTYFVVAHFHYVLVPGALFAILAGVYYWLPKWTGVYYNEKLGKWHFWLSMIGMNLTFFPMHFLGLAGMPRRIPDYALQFSEFNAMATVGAFIFGFAQFLFFVNIFRTVFGKGEKAPAKAWEGGRTLEWTIPSPAPYHSFVKPPVIAEDSH